MFGNFLSNFGLDFQLPQANAQGGLFGSDAPVEGQPPLGGPAAPGGAGTGLNVSPPASTAAKAPPGITGGAGNMAAPGSGGSPASFSQRFPRGAWDPQGQGPSIDQAFSNVNTEYPLGNALRQQQPAPPSPLGSPFAPGAGSGFQNQPAPDPAPAAGVGSQFKQQGGF